jgi:hypothetical protein
MNARPSKPFDWHKYTLEFESTVALGNNMINELSDLIAKEREAAALQLLYGPDKDSATMRGMKLALARRDLENQRLAVKILYDAGKCDADSWDFVQEKMKGQSE